MQYITYIYIYIYIYIHIYLFGILADNTRGYFMSFGVYFRAPHSGAGKNAINE